MTPQPIASSAVPVANAGRVPLEFLKYFATSVIALAIDAGLLAALTRAGAPYQSAAAAGFLCGLALAYILSVRWVFDVRAVGNGAVEFGAFAMIGFAGLGLTELFLWAAIDKCHIGLALAKACSAGGVFLFNFGVRKALLFRGRG